MTTTTALSPVQFSALRLLVDRPDRGVASGCANSTGVEVSGPNGFSGDHVIASGAGAALVRRGFAVGPIMVRGSRRYYVTPAGIEYEATIR